MYLVCFTHYEVNLCFWNQHKSGYVTGFYVKQYLKNPFTIFHRRYVLELESTNTIIILLCMHVWQAHIQIRAGPGYQFSRKFTGPFIRLRLDPGSWIHHSKRAKLKAWLNSFCVTYRNFQWIWYVVVLKVYYFIKYYFTLV